MSNEIIKILDDLAQRFGVAIDWTAENVLPYLKDLLGRLATYKITVHSIWTGIFFILFLACVAVFINIPKSRAKCIREKQPTCFYYWSKYGEKASFDEDSIGMLICIAGLALIFLIGLSININGIVKWSFIPEIQIIEWVKTNLIT
jgi:hypothetical protein